jgi:hypothetical protein
MGVTPNILIVLAVPLRADHLSCYGWHLKTSPNIDSLASEGTLFTQAYSTAAWTPPAHASLLTGLYPSRHGVVGESGLHHLVPTMPELLSSMGYRTVAFVQQSLLGPYTGLNRGFHEFYELWRPSRMQSITSKVKKTLISHAPASTVARSVLALPLARLSPGSPLQNNVGLNRPFSSSQTTSILIIRMKLLAVIGTVTLRGEYLELTGRPSVVSTRIPIYA